LKNRRWKQKSFFFDQGREGSASPPLDPPLWFAPLALNPICPKSRLSCVLRTFISHQNQTLQSTNPKMPIFAAAIKNLRIITSTLQRNQFVQKAGFLVCYARSYHTRNRPCNPEIHFLLLKKAKSQNKMPKFESEAANIKEFESIITESTLQKLKSGI